MKPTDHSKNLHGTVLVFVVLLLAVGAFVLAGFAQLASTQALVGQEEWNNAVARRIRVENSRAMARQYVMQNMFASTLTNDASYTDTPDFGGFQLQGTGVIGDYWAKENSSNVPINPFTLMERGGYFRVLISGNLVDGSDHGADWQFMVRTRSPIAAGYTIVQHLPANNDVSGLAGGTYHINMSTNSTKVEQFLGYPEMARMRVSSVTNTNSGDTTGFAGYLDDLMRVNWPTNNGAEWVLLPGNTNGKMVINLGTNSGVLPSSAYYVPPTHLFTNASTNSFLPVEIVEVVGTDLNTPANPLPNLPIIVSGVNVTNFILKGNNPADGGRRVYVHYQHTNLPLVISTDGVTEPWRIGITALHSHVKFDNGVTLVGGVRTDKIMLGQTNALYFQPETDPGGLDSIADRMMWLEDYRNLGGTP